MIDLKKLRTKNMGESALVHSAGHIRRIRHSVVAGGWKGNGKKLPQGNYTKF